MARRCTTVPGYGTCCRAAQQGLLNQTMVITDSRGNKRCAECQVIQKRKGGQGFKFLFHKSAECGIGPGGCPYLNTGAIGGLGRGGRQLQLQAPGNF